MTPRDTIMEVGAYTAVSMFFAALSTAVRNNLFGSLWNRWRARRAVVPEQPVVVPQPQEIPVKPVNSKTVFEHMLEEEGQDNG
jgi:hypothetical protein